MAQQQSQSGAVISGTYLLITLAAASPLVQEGYIGHGNGLSFVLTLLLTSPLSVILLALDDLLFDWNAFYMTGWPYAITLGQLGAGALLNARLLYMLNAFVRRKWYDA
jgi:hypothetical protein